MTTFSNYIKCSNCGVEFLSAFSSANLVIACIEHCPNCSTAINTPSIFDEDSEIAKSINAPMIREYGHHGSDGYVFMGKGHLYFAIRHNSLTKPHSTYERNIKRALDLLDLYYEVNVTRKQLVLANIYISLMTAFEVLVDDTLNALQNLEIISKLEGGVNFKGRQEHLLLALNINAKDHLLALRYLQVFRNCLVHSAGIVDSDFLNSIRRLGKVPSQLSTYEEGQPLILDVKDAISFADSLQQITHCILNASQSLCDARINTNNSQGGIMRP